MTLTPTQILQHSDTQANLEADNPTIGQASGPNAVEFVAELDSGFVKSGAGVGYNAAKYMQVNPLGAFADNATSPNGVLTIPAGLGTAQVIPNLPTYAQAQSASSTLNLSLPAGFAIQHSGVIQTLIAARIPPSTYNSAQWTSLGAASSAPLSVNTTAITASGTLVAGYLQEVNAGSSSLSMALPTGVTNEFLAVKRSDSTAGITNPNTLAITGTFGGPTTSVNLYWQDETVLFFSDSTGAWWIVSSHKPLSMLDQRYQPALPNVQLPVGASWPGGTTTANGAQGLGMYGRRYIANQPGTLGYLNFFVSSGAGSGIDVAFYVYDTGDAAAGYRTLLGSSGSTLINSGAGWYSVALTAQSAGSLTFKAHQHYDIAVEFNNTALVVGADTNPASAGAAMTWVTNSGVPQPSNFFQVPGGAPPKMSWSALPVASGGQTPSTAYAYGTAYTQLPESLLIACNKAYHFMTSVQ